MAALGGPFARPAERAQLDDVMKTLASKALLVGRATIATNEHNEECDDQSTIKRCRLGCVARWLKLGRVAKTILAIIILARFAPRARLICRRMNATRACNLELEAHVHLR